MAKNDKKTSPKDYGRWDKTSVQVISKPKAPKTTKKKVKKGK